MTALIYWALFCAMGQIPPAQVPERVFSGDVIEYVKPDIDLGSFNSKDIPVGELLRQISREKKVNIVVDQQIPVRLSLQLHQTTLNELLNLLVQVYGIRCEVVGNIIYARPALPPPVPQPVNDIIFDQQNQTISFDLSGLEVAEFARQVTRISGVNLLLKTPQGRVQLKGFQAPLPLRRGLDVFLQTHGLLLQVEDDVLFIASAAAQPSANPAAGSVAQTQAQTPVSPLVVEDGLITAHFDGVALQDLVGRLAATGIAPFIIQGALEGQVSIHVEKIGLESLLRLILADNGHSYAIEDGIFVIGAKASQTLSDSTVVKLRHLNAEMAEQILPANLREGADVTIIKELNSLLLSGERAKVVDLARLIEKMDRPVPQVLIEVMVVDFTFSNDRNIGVSVTNGDNKIFPELDLSLEGFRNETGSFQVRRLPSNFAVRLRALETQGRAKIISKPHVAALNGHEASIKIGSKQFYRIESEELVGDENPRVRTSQEIREIEANIFLKITPWVSGNGEVTTVIEPNFTSFLGQVNDNIPPPISSRELKSTVRLKDGETIILGGLIENRETLDLTGVPFLSRVPLVGALFRNRDKTSRQSELIIYITPHVYFGGEGSVEFISEQEGLDYQLDIKKQKLGIPAELPQKKRWWRRKKRKAEPPAKHGATVPTSKDPAG